jgi:hypothetical protein
MSEESHCLATHPARAWYHARHDPMPEPTPAPSKRKVLEWRRYASRYCISSGVIREIALIHIAYAAGFAAGLARRHNDG